MASVKVAVRVRPFNRREIDKESSCIVKMDGDKTRLFHPKGLCDNRDDCKEFTFDFSYWSHCEKDEHFASQELLYEDLGSTVVSNALQGYNACVFAYGQTGSGKTYTMMGSQLSPGLIPRICQSLFSRMEEGREEGTTYKVEVSYLEIYNERVRDLLRTDIRAPSHTLKVREHPEKGIYVENLSTHLVNQYKDIQELMNRGNNARTTACTHMNDTSSRSHAIFTVTFIQAKLLSETPSETRSKVHLVDLAGSERADATGASGQRLKEGAHINKSLVTLGSVISALAEQSTRGGAQKKPFIPYRDSVLTWLLKDSLGGNSKTLMIATISPANGNYGESLSTLRYANRAKNIINKPTINEDPNVKLIRDLRDEIAKLKSQIGGNVCLESEVEGNKNSILEALSRKQAQEKALTDQWTERWRVTHMILQEQKTLGLRKATESGHGVVLESDNPHLVLIDDDLLSTGVTLYHLNDGVTTIGSSPSQDIKLQGDGILEEHCTITLGDDGAFLEPTPESQCWVNSILIDRSTKLSQGGVIVLGASHMFRYNNPQEAAQLRKEGNKSLLNQSRFSFLSRSTTDLFRSYDPLPGSDSDFLEKRPLEDSSIYQAKKAQLTDFCEMSTQTSLQTHSHPSTPVAASDSSLPQLSARKSSLSLHLEGIVGKQTTDVSNISSHSSTPTSDTFYTATSILSPDQSELLSPLPLDSMNPVITRIDEGAEAGNMLALPLQENPMSSSVYKSPLEEFPQSGLGGSQALKEKGDNLITSPLNSVTSSQLNNPGVVGGVATSTPKQCYSTTSTSNLRISDDIANNLISPITDIPYPEPTKRLHLEKCPSAICFDSKSLKNATETFNKTSSTPNFTSKNLDNKENSEISLNEVDTSELIAVGQTVDKATKIIEKLRSKAEKGDLSIDEKINELKALHGHYTTLEGAVLKDHNRKRSTEQVANHPLCSTQDSNKGAVERPSTLAIDAQAAAEEERLAMLIEMEVQRRVIEEVQARHNVMQRRFSVHTLPGRMIRSTSPDTFRNPRVLSPSEIRPYSSLSAEFDHRRGHLYQNIYSDDDLLLTSEPLHSPLNDFVVACEICITIPSYEMVGAGSASHWEYEVHIVAGGESWILLRRYKRFYELNEYMRRKYGKEVDKIPFPPRRLFNASEAVVAERRQKLEDYLQQLIITCSEIEGCPLSTRQASKSSLVAFSQFFHKGSFERSRHMTS